jgi:hypothetical protein
MINHRSHLTLSRKLLRTILVILLLEALAGVAVLVLYKAYPSEMRGSHWYRPGIDSLEVFEAHSEIK